ncbi:uncharacterized protein NPIL_433711 [Nephila pilipes]|uniref:Uncharacterized protein n=1 Tax=Nephila pilipes TaxID=299642 RepID=A0A8X6IAG4_NEPPI|nr:uncharacterized protein NPIL_433711 [Nephila pilipes]
MVRIHLLSLLLAISLILLSNFSRTEVQAAIPINRRLLDATDDGNYQQYLGNVINNRRFRMSLPPSDMDLLNALRKRQIRYHPCYFNPVSCFRRK